MISAGEGLEPASPRLGNGNGAATAGGLPELVQQALERNALVRSVLARWTEASVRLGLSPLASAATALLLCAEFDEPTANALRSTSGGPTEPTRKGLLKSLHEVPEPQAAAALGELEQRGIVNAVGADRAWLGQELQLAPEVRAHCVGSATVRENGSTDATTDGVLVTSPTPVPRLGATLEALERLEREVGGRNLLVTIRGGTGSGRDGILAQVLAACRCTALVRSTSGLASATSTLEPELSGAAAVWDARRSDPTPVEEELAARWLGRSTTIAVAVLGRRQDAPEVSGRRVFNIDVDPAGFEERLRIWQPLLDENTAAPSLATGAATLLARRNRCGAGLAARATRMADPLGSDPRAAVVKIERALGELIRPSSQRGIVVERPTASFSRLIVSDAVGAVLEQLVVLAELSSELAGTERRGVKALFAGPSGTGKTLAARALASHLDLPLYRVDLASVVSKWVGETEKNLSQALEAAELAGAVLLFDEGDALLAKRGEISRGTDRYANLEVSYLLQALEAHDGVVIVTTNQKQNIDTAFQRRFDLIVEFASPSVEARALLWRQELGASSSGLSPDFVQTLAAADLSGGNIAGAARLARAIAHGRGESTVTTEDVQRAVAAEFRKVGSTVQASNWAGLVKRNA